ncbi:MAG: helix-turn-helix domain-containing protein [Candidatus Eremiobacteraeota bacterium]|nr:helix-turn-helix domain-containing protein [Candidatus Eremiobacteraeota bacterium]
MAALGDEFRVAREARGLSLSEVAEKIHIRSVYLNAIEHEDWPAIGAPVYVRGFIRTYARFLGLEPESIVDRFNEMMPAERSVLQPHPTASLEDERPAISPWALGGIVIAIVLVAFVGYEWWAFAHGAPAKNTAAVSGGAVQPGQTTGGSSPAARPVATAAPRHQLALRLTEPSWMRVTVDGATVVEGTLPAGTMRTFRGSVADVRAGNAGGVTVSVDGRPYERMGKTGDVVDQRFTL